MILLCLFAFFGIHSRHGFNESAAPREQGQELQMTSIILSLSVSATVLILAFPFLASLLHVFRAALALLSHV
jgi:hypothetical protein